MEDRGLSGPERDAERHDRAGRRPGGRQVHGYARSRHFLPRTPGLFRLTSAFVMERRPFVFPSSLLVLLFRMYILPVFLGQNPHVVKKRMKKKPSRSNSRPSSMPLELGHASRHHYGCMSCCITSKRAFNFIPYNCSLLKKKHRVAIHPLTLSIDRCSTFLYRPARYSPKTRASTSMSFQPAPPWARRAARRK